MLNKNQKKINHMTKLVDMMVFYLRAKIVGKTKVFSD